VDFSVSHSYKGPTIIFLKTNCNPNPGIEVVHGKMMPFRRLVLHFICVILAKTVYMC